MNRYIERADNNARFLEVNFNLALDLPMDVKEQWKPVVAATGGWSQFRSLHSKPAKQNVIHYIGFDEKNPNSIYSCIHTARENAKGIRESISSELWAQINELYYLVKEAAGKHAWMKRDPRKFFEQVREGIQLFYGIALSTQARTEGWHFGMAGRYLERADNTARMLDVKYHIILPSVDSVGSPIDLIHWAALLKSVNAYNMYRQRYGSLAPHQIAQYLILDQTFPRAIMFCLAQAEISLREISGERTGFGNQAEKLIGAFRSDLEFAEISDVIKSGLHEFLEGAQVRIAEISMAITEKYFTLNTEPE